MKIKGLFLTVFVFSALFIGLLLMQPVERTYPIPNITPFVTVTPTQPPIVITEHEGKTRIFIPWNGHVPEEQPPAEPRCGVELGGEWLWDEDTREYWYRHSDYEFDHWELCSDCHFGSQGPQSTYCLPRGDGRRGGDDEQSG